MNTNAISTDKNFSSYSNATTGKSQTDSDMFMTLLVAQLKNQDPLEPQDGAAFVAQLAQFNSLEQLTGIRQSIDKLVTQLQQTGQTPPNTNQDQK